MRTRLILSLAFAAIGSAPAAAQSPASTPALSAEGVFQDWLRAINGGDAATIKAFYARHDDDPDALFAREMAEDTCGFDVAEVEKREPLTLRVRLRERCFDAQQRLTIVLESAQTPRLKMLRLSPLPMSDRDAAAATVAIADRLARRDKFAGSLLVTRGRQRLIARSWGTLDADHRARITHDTPMFLASAGKMFTAVAVLQLVEAGRVDLDAPLGRYLADYPNAAMARVTVRQLLRHRGGTGDVGILARGEGANRARVRTLADIIALNGNRAPDFPPDSKVDYSNYGFVLLGAIVERVSGLPYADYVARHVFRPAGMTHAGFPDRDHLRGVATGYTTFFGEEPALQPNLDVLPWRGTPAGGGVASARDMHRFLTALTAGKLLAEPTVKLATTVAPDEWYGMGFVVNPGPARSFGHGGMSYGMDVAAHVYPTADTTFVCTASRDGACNRLITAWFLRRFASENDPETP